MERRGERISELENRTNHLIWRKENRLTTKINKQINNRVSRTYETVTKKSNIYIIRVSERKEKGSRAKTIFEEIMTEDFPSFGSDKPRFKN